MSVPVHAYGEHVSVCVGGGGGGELIVSGMLQLGVLYLGI